MKTSVPESPPIVPGSSVRSRLIQVSSMKSTPAVASSCSPPSTVTTRAMPTISAADATNRPMTSAPVPRAMKLSNA